MRKLLPILLALMGLVAGSGAGYLLMPAKQADAQAEETPEMVTPERDLVYVPLSNQFVIPLVEGGRVGSMVVVSLSIATLSEHQHLVEPREARLRDSFIRVMFDHANAGGFRGNFTTGEAMAPLRDALRESARKVLGPEAKDVLIVDIVRQDN